MAAGQIIVPGAMPTRDRNGKATIGKLFFYEDGTQTPAPVYTTSALTTALANPVVSDAAGRFPAIWADDAELFTVVWTYDDEETIKTYSGVSAAEDAVLASVAMAQAAADEAAADAVQTGADLAAIQAIEAAGSAAPAIAGKLNRNGDNAQAGLYAAIGEQTAALTAATDVQDGDLLASYRSTGPLKKLTASTFADYIKAFFSASGGSALVGFIQAGTGAIARTLQARGRERINVTDYGSLAEAVAAAPSGASIFCPDGYTHTVAATIPISKDVTIFAKNWRTVIITGPANAPIFQAVVGAAVTNFVLEGITWVGGAGTSQLLKVPTGSSWFEGKTVIRGCKINNFGNFAIERGDSVYLTEIKGNRFDNCVGCISEGWASDSVIDDNLFNDAMEGNPVMRLVGGSRTVVTSNDFIRAAGTLVTQADIELNPDSSFGRGGRVYILHNKFGGEGEVAGRPKIRTYNATAQNRATDVIVAFNQLHGAAFSAGGTAHCFQFDNPIAGWIVKDNEFDDFDLIVQDNVANYEGFLGSNQWEQNRYFWSSRRAGNLFLNGGRMFTSVSENVFGYRLPQLGYEPPEARNRVEYSSAITSWNKSSGVTITGGQSDPDGGTDAFLIESDGTAVAQSASRRIDSAGIAETAILKLRLKAQAGTKLMVGVRDTTVSPSRWVGMFQVLVLDDKWREYRFTLTGIVSGNVNALTFYPAGSAVEAVAGGFYIYQPQISDYESDYIPTPINAGVVDTTIGRRFSRKVNLVSGAVVGGTLNHTGTTLGFFGVTPQVKSTGWGAMTGTATKTTIATYTAPTISATYSQAEVQAIADALQSATRRLKAYDDLFISLGLANV